MTQNERIEAIRSVFPGYSKPLDSMCKRPEYYGVKRTPEAQALISKKRPKRDVYNLHVCVPNGFVDMVEFRRLDANAYCWVLIGALSEALGRPRDEIYRHYVREMGVNSIVCLKSDAADELQEAWGLHGLGWLTDAFWGTL